MPRKPFQSVRCTSGSLSWRRPDRALLLVTVYRRATGPVRLQSALMGLRDAARWSSRAAAVYALGVWTMIGSYAYFRYTGRLEDAHGEWRSAAVRVRPSLCCLSWTGSVPISSSCPFSTENLLNRGGLTGSQQEGQRHSKGHQHTNRHTFLVKLFETLVKIIIVLFSNIHTVHLKKVEHCGKVNFLWLKKLNFPNNIYSSHIKGHFKLFCFICDDYAL